MDCNLLGYDICSSETLIATYKTTRCHTQKTIIIFIKIFCSCEKWRLAPYILELHLIVH